MYNTKISTIVKNQVPDFVKEEYPKFILFLEAYYKFLEQEYPLLNITNNNLLEEVNKLKYVSDVDESLDSFEEHFFNNFLPYLPRDSSVSKDILIKNIMPIYLAKGSEQSFKLLFRMLFDHDVTLTYPRDNILRASDGRWSVRNVLSISNLFYSLYINDGIQQSYYLPESYNQEDFSVYVNSVLSTDYLYFKAYREIRFNTLLSENDEIKIVYSNFNTRLFTNRLVTGLTSTATCIVENVNETRTGMVPYFDIYFDQKRLVGTFSNNEVLRCDLLIDSQQIPVFFKPYSILETITITNGGASYNVGDPVPIYGTSEHPAIVIIDQVSSGTVEDITIDSGGIGFKVNNSIVALTYPTETFLAKVLTVDSSGITSSNSVTLNDDVIANYANIALDNTYGFAANASATLTARIDETLHYVTIGQLGSITSVEIITSSINSTISPTFDVISEEVTDTLTLRDFGIIGKININSGGQNYQVGDYLIFTNNNTYGGYGANAQVATVAANGAITRVKINSGGMSYQQSNFPTITVNTASGTGANLTIFNILGDGESLTAVYAAEPAGSIKRIRVLDPGLNYVSTPIVDLSQIGNGEATADVVIKNSVSSLSGKWTTSDGKLSNKDINLQGRDYFIDFSYVINTHLEFNKYKDIVKNLLHPSGLINYSNYKLPEYESSLDLTINIESEVSIIAP